MTGTNFSRAAEGESWILEILQHMQLQDSDTELKIKKRRFED